MKRKHSVSEKRRPSSAESASAGKPVRGAQVVNLEKQYHELRRLREQVQIEESRQHVTNRAARKLYHQEQPITICNFEAASVG